MTKLWGGRFSKKTHTLVDNFGRSIQFDYKLARYDCLGSLAQISVLQKAGLLKASEYKKLKIGLGKILKSIDSDTFQVDELFEDIHSYIQHLLENDKAVGKTAYKLHTCRSRNDQVIFDTKLYCLDNLKQTQNALENLNKTLLSLANQNNDIFMPGYTHLQHAIPVSLAEYFRAHAQMLKRDSKRLDNAFKQIEVTLGSGALAGTFIPAVHYFEGITLSKDLKIKVTASKNSMDTVSDRDFIIEILSAIAITGMHLSRLSEDMILWASNEFDFIDIDDSFCTGSSLMPQKKNPDVFELVRGMTGKFYGNLMNVLVVMKGLPFAYNRDMQHDKEPLFQSFEGIQEILILLSELFKNVSFKKENIAKQLDDESLFATDLADHLVQNGVTFKESHSFIGQLIQYKFKNDILIKEMTADELKKIHPLLTPKVVNKILCPRTSVSAKKSIKK